MEGVREADPVRALINPDKVKFDYDEKIVSDMTIITHRGIRHEWTYFLDVYNNSIIAWDISNKAGDIKPYYTCRNKLLEIIKKEGLYL